MPKFVYVHEEIDLEKAVKQEEVLKMLDTLAGYAKKAKNYGWEL